MQWGAFGLQTAATCPTNYVMRDPYPRALVNKPVNFRLLLDEQYRFSPSKAGSWAAPVSPVNINSADLAEPDGAPKYEGLFRKVTIGLRGRRLEAGEEWFGYKAITPTWTFNTGNGERTWNGSSGGSLQQKNVTSTFMYQTSSAGLPSGGRAFDSNSKQILNAYTLPAYQVQLETACGFEWAMNWEISVKDKIVKDPPTAPCYVPSVAQPAPANPATEGCPAGQVANGRWKYKWEMRAATDCGDGVLAFEGWCGQDMKHYGVWALPYSIRRNTTEGGVFKGTTYWSPQAGGIKVPVIEVQTVMRDECVANGTCSPPTAPGASLAP